MICPLILTLLMGQMPANESAGPERPAPRTAFTATQPHMGTRVTIVLYAADEQAAEQAFDAAFARFAAVDRALSDYDPESELSRLSRQSPTPAPVAVSGDLWRVLSKSRQMSERSGGAFDVTIGPLSRLWRQARRQRELPADEALAEARQAVGYQAIHLHPETQSVELTKPRMRLDLGGIAKGYGVDVALAALRKQGIVSALVDAGGDLAASDSPPDKPYWTVGVRAVRRDGEPTHFLKLANSAVATSGDAWQYLELDGVKYSHIIDPKTGLGLTERSGVTIIARDCMTADACASAVSVLGPDAGRHLIESSRGIAGMIATAERGEPRLWMSQNVRPLLIERPIAE